MKSNRICIIPLVVYVVLTSSALLAYADRLDDVRRDISGLRYDDAEAKLVDLARTAKGEDRQEALYLLAGLKRSVSEAQIIYQEVARIDESNRWGTLAQIELAKIEFAVGDYEEAFEILSEGGVCRQSQEACYFQGMSAVMLEEYDSARELLSKVKGGRFRPWAYLSLAEVETRSNNPDEACQRYRSMARSFISPTAMYRYGECLEKQGQIDDAAEVFGELLTTFQSTPEALLAAEKLSVLTREPEPPARQKARADSAAMTPLSTGYTLQFGAFNDRANAIKLAARLKRDLPGVRIDTDLLDFKEVHRVRFGYFRTRAEAVKSIEDVSKKVNEPCTVMTLP
ncbi:MAG: SPOR domain-containing protein [Candidatus Latescibacterota bacterium]|nr:MAG: SPOR domain-containing protein [Candidatus Latescibacterota bacterium]